MKKILSFLLTFVALSVSTSAFAAVENVAVGGWYEGGYVTWDKVEGFAYNVYLSPAGSESWTKLDTELVREYPTQGRADAVGITAGQYKFKIVPVKDGAEVAADAKVTEAFTATAYDRGGFAHFKSANASFNPANGVGAYKNDGTLKAGAKVIYVYADNAKTITTDVVTDSKGGKTKGVGLQNIISLYEKGQDKTPICFRIIGTLKAADMDSFGSSAEGIQIKGRNSYSEMNITIEGIGNDATIHGFGFLIRNACSLELRNFAIMWCMDDAVSMDTDNCNLWVHNLDLFYGQPGGAADQKKGDGTLDIKGDSKYSTLSYNHLWDSGKSSLCGMKGESGPNYLTYHHNWFDHSDSRHPRVRTMTVHVYNNYFDGNSKYGIGAAQASNIFAENNYFRNCKYPMLSSKQGSDVNNGVGTSDQTKGTFSGEDGGIVKAFGNLIEGAKRFQAYNADNETNKDHFDAYVAASRDEKVPGEVKALQGGRQYDNFDTDPELMYTGYQCHAAADVKDAVTGALGAGRCQHGDFKWTFGANEDTNDQVIAALSKAINDYKSMLVGFFGQEISNGGATTEQGGGSDEGSGTGGDEGIDDGGEDNSIEEEAYITGEMESEYFFFNQENAEKVNEYLTNGTITLGNSTVADVPESKFDPTYTNINYKKDSAGNPTAEIVSQTVYTGSINLGKASSNSASDGGSVIFRCDKGVTTFDVYVYRTGSVYMKLFTSTDGKTWKQVDKVEKGSTGIFTKNFSSTVADKDHYLLVKILNTSTGGLNIQGVRILNEKGATVKEPSEATGGEEGGEQGGGNAGTGDVDASALYKFTVKEIVPKAVKDGVEQNYSDEIATQGGKFVFGNVSKIEPSDVAASGYGVKMDGNASATNTKNVKVILDAPLKVGDKIAISCYATSNPSNNYGISIYNEDQSKLYGSVYNTKKNVEETLTLEVAAGSELIGVSTLCLVRNADKSAYFTGITITGEANSSTGIVSVDSAPASSATYDLQGRRVASMQKNRIYIQNGKKVVAF